MLLYVELNSISTLNRVENGIDILRNSTRLSIKINCSGIIINIIIDHIPIAIFVYKFIICYFIIITSVTIRSIEFCHLLWTCNQARSKNSTKRTLSLLSIVIFSPNLEKRKSIERIVDGPATSSDETTVSHAKLPYVDT